MHSTQSHCSRHDRAGTALEAFSNRTLCTTLQHFGTSNISISLPNKSHLSSVGHTQVQYTTNRVSNLSCATRQMNTFKVPTQLHSTQISDPVKVSIYVSVTAKIARILYDTCSSTYFSPFIAIFYTRIFTFQY